MDSETIKNSIVNMRDKVVPQPKAEVPVSTEPGDLILNHAAYDFLGLNFANRTGRENMETNKKVQAILEYARENSEDPIAFLRQMEAKLGQADNAPLLEKLYHAVKFREKAEEIAPLEERRANYSQKSKEAQLLIEDLKKQLASAKETARINARLAIIEKQKEIFEKKLAKLNG